MILLLGRTGYVGNALAEYLRKRGLSFVAPSHSELDASDRDSVAHLIESLQPTFVLNAIGFTGRPNIDSTEKEKLRCLTANTLVPGVLAEILADKGIPFGHVSSGCIYDGARPDGLPFTEDDPPNFAFNHPQASWYSRTKAMAETMLSSFDNTYIWRLRIPFDQFDHDRNYLTKVMKYDRLLEVENSISQLQEAAAACVEMLLRRVTPGIYNVTNPGSVTTSEVAQIIKAAGLTDKNFVFFTGEREFLATPDRVKRASCILSSQKLADTGIHLREIHDSLEWTLKHWQWRK